MIEDLTIKKYALHNAILHGGKADQIAVIRKIIAEDTKIKSKIKSIIPKIQDVVSKVNGLTIEEQRIELMRIDPSLVGREKREREPVLPPLPNVSDTVRMRLAPFPSGPLHIGNARMVLLNDEYVKRYNGKLYLVFDDTIGSKEKVPVKEGYELIKDGLDWLGVRYHEIVYKSDRIEIFYDWCVKLLSMGHGYVCECPQQTLAQYRKEGIECEHRSQSVDINMDKWHRMLSGGYGEGDAVVRLKTDMKHKNPAFRDRVLFRISEREHPRVGKRYRVWPLLEISWAIDDYLLQISHILRGKDLTIEDEMESYIWNLFGIKGPEFVHYGMLAFKESKLSKSKSRAEIESGELAGWEDPRTWSLQSLRDRGIRPDAIRKFILNFGVSLTDIEVPTENLYSENRKIVDNDTVRLFFVPEPVEITLNIPPELRYVKIPNHPTNPDKGTRTVNVGSRVYVAKEDFEKYVGKEVRLKDLCNLILDKNGKFVSREKKDIDKIQWVSEGIKVIVLMPDGSTVVGLGEENIRNLKVHQLVQFERFGFVCMNKITDREAIGYFAHK